MAPIRSYNARTELVTGYQQDARWSVLAPSTADLTNIITNPSVETNATGYTAVGGSIARSLVKQRRGAYSLAVTPTSAVNDGVFFGTVSVTANVLYPWSFDFWGNPGTPYKAYWATTGGVQVGTSVQFVGKGRWKRIEVPYGETSTTTRRLYIVKNNSASTAVFYVDGMLIPSNVGGLGKWRYFDGDSQGMVPNQVDFYWAGTPHGSTSVMRAFTRAGGKFVPLSDLGFVLTAMMGLGLSTPNNITTPLALPGGLQYQRTLSPAQSFDLVGYLQGMSMADLNRMHSDLTAVLDVRRQPKTQPIILQYEPIDGCGDTVGETAEIICNLAGGLEGIRDNHYLENLDLKFQNYTPNIAKLGANEGASLNTRNSFTAGYVVRRNTNGIWGALNTSGLNGGVNVIQPMPNGYWLIGGSFTNAGGIADADRLAYYDPTSDTFIAVNATPLDSDVYALLLLADGNVLVGGAFNNAGGFANADRLTLLTVSTGAFSALNATPLSGFVYALAQFPTGDVAMGGSFLNAGGDANADYLAKITLSTGAYSSFNATPLNNEVRALEVASNGLLYIGGSFTDVGGFANQDYLTILVPPYGAFYNITVAGTASLSATVTALQQMVDGSMLIGGNFVNVQSDSTWDYLIRSVQSAVQGAAVYLLWSKPFGSISDAVNAVAETVPGVRVIGGQFTSVGSVALFDAVFQYSGSTILPIDLDLPGVAGIVAIGSRPNTELMLGGTTTGTAYTSGTTTLSNSGSASTQPVIILSYSSVATVVAKLYSIRNLTTGQTISFNFSLLPGETLTFNFQQGTITSNYRGNLNSSVLPGSNLSTFVLVPGSNVINIFIDIAAAANATAYAYWEPQYVDLFDLND